MKKIIVICKPVLIGLTSLTFFLNAGCTSEQTTKLPDEDYKITTSDYIILAEKSSDVRKSDEFESFGLILKITGTANVSYKAKIKELNPVLRTDNGTTFLTKIGGCN